MDRNNKTRAARLGYILISIALCVLGIVSIAVPTLSAVRICRISGVLMILFGIIKILGYCSRDLYRLAFQHDLASGILLLALGTVMLVPCGRASVASISFQLVSLSLRGHQPT